MKNAASLVLALAAMPLASAAEPVTWLPSMRQTLSYSDRIGVQSHRTDLALAAEIPLSPVTSLTLATHLEFDGRDRLEPGPVRDRNRSRLTRRHALGERGLASLDEFYLDTQWQSWKLRLGKQQLVWGESDGFQVLDVLNPRNFREGVVEDAEQARIPLWMVHAEYRLSSRNHIEWVINPDLSFHDIPDSGALFEITSPLLAPPRPPSGSGDVPIEYRRPALAWDTLELATRLRFGWKALEGGIVAMRRHHRTPIQTLIRDDAAPHVERSYLLTHDVGLQLSHPVGRFLLRGEALYSQRAPLPVLVVPGTDQDTQAPRHSALIALETAMGGSGLASIQLLEIDLHAHSAQLDNPQRYVSLLVRQSWDRYRLEGEVFHAQSIRQADRLWKWRLRHRIDDQITVIGGIDLFSGTDTGVFGQHRKLDRTMIQIKLDL